MSGSSIPLPIPEYLPVFTHGPERIDVAFNLTPNMQLSTTPNYLDSVRPSVEDTIRGAIALFSQLAPSEGCVRISAIDILRLKVVVDRSAQDAASNVSQILKAIPASRNGQR
ncbi:MAG TPA: hypothetical protein VKW78_06660 [Terriglobales bacterium]|nr:hypothetical protein [Terriglobales bacterium]